MAIRGNKLSYSSFLKFADAVLYFTILVLVLLIGVICFKVIYPEGDVMEHIYSTFLVSTGEVPYRDFFEHHHPLLWYIFAPFIGLLFRNPEVIGWSYYVTFCFFLGGLYFVYRTIKEFFVGRTAALLAVIYLLLPDIFVYYVYYKPDNFMLACVSIGLYYFFCYFRDCKRYQLVLSYLFLFVAFLFIQKALFYYPIIAVVTLWALYKKQMPVKDFLWALVLPIVGLGVLIGYFYQAGGLKEYFYLNFLFNKTMTAYYGKARICSPFFMGQIALVAGLVTSVIFYKSESLYFRVWCWLFWWVLLQRAFYFSPHNYYWYEAYYFAVPLTVIGIMKFSEKVKLLLVVIFIETFIYAGFMGYYLYHDVVYKPKKRAVFYHEILLNYTNPCDEYVSFGGASLVLFTKVPQYYWFLQGHLDVFGEKMGLHKVEDLNAIIKQHKPKIVYVDTVYERYSADAKNKKVIHKPDMEMIEKYYEPTNFVEDFDFDFELMQEYKLDYKVGLWVLKKEYQKKVCMQDKDGRWKYAED